MATRPYTVTQVRVVTVGAMDEEHALALANSAFAGQRTRASDSGQVSSPRIEEVRIARA